MLPTSDETPPDAQSPTSLPADLADMVLNQLAVDERVVWCAQPRVEAMALRNTRYYVLITVLGTLAFGPGLAAGVIPVAAAMMRANFGNDRVLSLAMVALPIPGLIFLGGAILRTRIRARNTAYVITDRRAMVVSIRPTRKIAAYAPAELSRAEARHRHGGRADIILARGPAAKAHGPTWNLMYGVEDADRVLRLIHELASTAGGGGPD